MIILTDQQLQELKTINPMAVDPNSKQEYVLVPRETYETMKQALYDDSEWTNDEMDALAWEAGKNAGWDDMSEYDNYQKP